MPKLRATFKPLVAIVCHQRQFCKMFSWLFCFVQVKALKSFSEKLYTSTIKKKRRSRGENCLHSCATSLFFITFWRHLWSRRTILNRHMKNVESITVKLILYHEKVSNCSNNNKTHQQIFGKINSTLCFLVYMFNRQINRTQSFDCCSIAFNRAYHVNYRTQSFTVRWVRLIWLIVSAS